MSLHVAVIGSGLWSRVHLAALAASPHVGRISLAGRNLATLAARAGEFPQVAATSDDYRRLLADATIDVVCIVLPHHLHAEIGVAALAAGKHVICEKPAGRDSAEFASLADAAQQHGRRLLVVMNQLYNPLPLRVRELLEAGEIGRPFLSIENSFASHAVDYHNPAAWRTSLAGAGGGVFIDGGYHMVYRHLYQLQSWGPPQWVAGEIAQLAIDPAGANVIEKGEDFVALTVGYPSSLRIHWNHGWSLVAEPVRRRQSFIAGSDGTLEFTDDRAAPLLLHRGGTSEAVRVTPGPWTGTETTHACLLDYLDCLATQREVEQATLALARLTLDVISSAYQAGRLAPRQWLPVRP